MNERSLPHTLDAEKAVIGSMFLSKYALGTIVEELSKEDFYLDAHQRIFEVVKYLAEIGTPIDITTVTAELDKRKILGNVGGV